MDRIGPTLLPVLLAATLIAADEPPKPVSFREQVAPILVKSCLGCHNTKKAAGGLDISTFALLKKGGKAGGDSILVAGDPDASELIEVVRPDASPRMPYKQPPLGDGAIQTLERWVKEGAKFDGPSETETPIASLYDPLKGLPAVPLKSPASDAVTSLAFSPDGTILAAAEGRRVGLYDAATGKPVATLDDHPGPLTTVAITPDGATLLALGGRPGMFGSITAWDLASKSKRYELKGHSDTILGASLSPDGATLATASYDRMVLLWDLGKRAEIRTLKDHTDAVYAVAFSPDGKQLATAGADRTVKLWDVATGVRKKTLSDATAELYAVTFDRSGELVLAAGVDRSIRSWRARDEAAPLLRSVFAHDGPVLRLVVSSDGKTLVSCGEDKDVKLWDLPELKARAALSGQSDWPQGLAIAPSGKSLAVGRYDGSLALFDAASAKLALDLKPASSSRPMPAKPELVRNATLSAPSPQGAPRGTTRRVTLNGIGVGLATRLIFAEPGLSGALLPAAKPDPNRLEVELTIARDARVGNHLLTVATPLGIPAFQPFAVSPYAESPEVEPDDDASKVKAIALPATLIGTIDKPGDVDHFRFHSKAGESLVFEVVAKSLGSGLLASLAVLDAEGKTLAEAAPPDGVTDPVLTVTVPREGEVVLRVADADYAGSGNHFYRINTASAPYLTDAYPLGVQAGEATTVRVEGLNLRGTEDVSMHPPADARAGQIREVPVRWPDGVSPINRRTVVVAEGPQRSEGASDANDRPEGAEPIGIPGGFSGRIGHEGDVDFIRFDAKKGQRLIVEIFGRRLGSPLDSVIEILDAKGNPVPRAVLRPIDQTEVAFRDHTSSASGIRLTRWNNLAINDFLLFGRELTRIKALPRNPDDDCQMWTAQGTRSAFLETTPEHHPMSQPIYKVEIHPPGSVFPAGGVPATTVNYRNDDGGAGLQKDSRLTFDPPADGAYLVRVEDVRGLGGHPYGYHLVVRKPRPDFTFALSTNNPNVPRGGTTLLTASIARLDGFDATVDVELEGLPAGVTATNGRIEAGEESTLVALSADASAPIYSAPTWSAVARALAPGHSASAHDEMVRKLDPGGSAGGWITVTPEPNLKVIATPRRVTIRPGQQVTMSLKVERGPAFKGRVPIDVRNLPQGVRVLNIGLNGVLVTESQVERTVTIYADPWVKAMERPFFAVGKAEAAGTEHSSLPISLVVSPGPAAPGLSSTSARP